MASNLFGPGNASSGNQAKISRDDRAFQARRDEAARDVQAGRVTLDQAYDRLNGR